MADVTLEKSFSESNIVTRMTEEIDIVLGKMLEQPGI